MLLIPTTSYSFSRTSWMNRANVGKSSSGQGAWTFAGMTEDASWGKVAHTGGSPSEVQELERLFDMMARFCSKHGLPAFIGEFCVTEQKESESRVRWLWAVMDAALSRNMVPVLWDTGHGVSRRPPHAPSADLAEVLQRLSQRP